MKKILLLVVFLCCLAAAFAQKKTKQEEGFYVLDENMKGSTVKKAKYLIHSVKKNDTCWQFDTYNMYGPMISSETFKDAGANILHGEKVYFNKKGPGIPSVIFLMGIGRVHSTISMIPAEPTCRKNLNRIHW